MHMTAVIGSAFVAAASFACIVRANPLGGYVPLPSKKDPCDKFADRTFRITTSSQNGVFGAVSQTFQAEIERNFDTKKTLAGPENSSCSIKKVGSGCKWGRQEESKLGDYKVDHPGYSPYVAVDTDVKISGDGCDDQTLKCSAEHSVLPLPEGDFIYIATTKCAVHRPESGFDVAIPARPVSGAGGS